MFPSDDKIAVPIMRFNLYYLSLLIIGAFILISFLGAAETDSMKFIAEYNLTDTADGIPSSGYDIKDVLYLPDNEHLVLTGTSKNLWNVNDRTYKELFGDTHTTRLAYNEDSNRLVIAENTVYQIFHVFNLNREPPFSEEINYDSAPNISNSRDVVFGENSSIIYLTDGRMIYRWDFHSEVWSSNLTVNLYDGYNDIRGLFFDKGRSLLIAVIRTGHCYILDTDLSIINRINYTGPLRPNRDYSPPLKPICYLENHSVVWTRGDVIIFNLTSGTYSRIELPSVVNSPIIIPSHNGKWIAIVKYGAVEILDLTTFESITHFLATNYISAMSWSYDDKRIVTVDYNGVAQVWINIKDPGYDQRPHVNITYPVEGQIVNNTLVVYGNASDDSVVSSVLYRIDSSPWTLLSGTTDWSFVWDTRYNTNGYHRISVRAFDGERFSHIATVNVNVQNNETSLIPPIITIELPVEGQIVSGQVTFSGRIMSLNEILRVRLSFDNQTRIAYLTGSHWFVSIDTTVLPDNPMTFQAVAYDGILNSTPALVNITIRNSQGPANKPPWVSITSPLDGETISGMLTIRGLADDPENQLSFLMIKLDDNPWMNIPPTSEWEYRMNSWTLPNGHHTVLAICFDDIQTSEISSITFNVSNDWNYPFGIPICIITSPSNGSYVSKTITITGTAHDDYSISSVWIAFEEGSAKMVEGSNEWHYSLDTTVFKNGLISFSVWAFDGINESSPVAHSLFIDNYIRPTCQIIWPDNGSIVDGVITIIGISNDDNTIDEVLYSIENNKISIANGTNYWNFKINTLDFPNGNVNVEVWANDSIDDSLHILWTLIIVNNQPPICNIERPMNNQIIQSNIEINGYAFDPDGDSILVEIRFNNGSWLSCSGGTHWSYHLMISDLPAGHHYIEARSYDGQLYSLSDIIILTLNKGTPPEPKSTYDTNPFLISILILLCVIIISLVLMMRMRNRIE